MFKGGWRGSFLADRDARRQLGPRDTLTPDLVRGAVLRTGGGTYHLLLESGREVEAVLRGRLKQEARVGDRVVIGDEVEVALGEEGATIEGVLPRRTLVARRAPQGRRPKVVAANLDRLFVVVATHEPEPARPYVDRLLVVAEAAGLEACLVVNKVDLDPAGKVFSRLDTVYRGIGYPVIGASVKTGAGTGPLRSLVCAGRSALVGPSGVGKSSLLNALDPSLRLEVGELSHRKGTARGRQTTVSARMILLDCGGMVADTPGFSEVGPWEVDPSDLDRYFPEFVPLVDDCRFRGCAHRHEPGCAVQEAVDRGAIDPGRYESYVVLYEELSESSSDA